MSEKEEKFETLKQETKKETRKYTRISENQLFDIEENIMVSILHNMKRSDALSQARHFCESQGLGDIPEKRLIQIYNSARDKLFEYRLEGIAAEKEKIVKRLYRIGSKAEMRGDFANAYKAYNRIAEIAGVDDEKDDSKVILNFVAAKPKVIPAEKILEADTPKKEDKKK